MGAKNFIGRRFGPSNEMIKGVKIKNLDIKRDERGWFAEIVRSEDIENNSKPFGQMYATTANPGQTKGKHYHTRKTEWFCVIKGKGLLTLVNMETQEKQEIEMGEDNMAAVQIPPNVWHAIANIGDREMFLLAYIDESYNPNDPDTIAKDI